MRFSTLGLQEATVLALEAMGFEEATPIQEQAIPPLLLGRDIMAQAQTGTGKTAAFGIPLVEAARNGRRGLVLTPTRELAKQVQRELQAIAHGAPVDVVCLIGGAPFGDQVRALQRHPGAILVATPGRVVDHLQRQTLDLSKMAILTLDEADEMLSMGFAEELAAIVATMPSERQTMLFTATLTPPIERLARETLRDPLLVRIAAGKGGAASQVDQRFALVAGRDRPHAVRRILEAEEPEAALLFARTRERVEELAEALRDLGAEALHGGLAQPARDAVMERFRKGRTKLLVATDVAARGLDVEGIQLVLHDEAAPDTDTYIHRIGRTGRAGRSGRSIVLLAPGRMHHLNAIQRVAGRLERYDVPDAAAIAKLRTGRLVLGLQAAAPGAAAQAAIARARADGMADDAIALAALELLLARDEPAAADAAPAPPSRMAICLKVGAVDQVGPGAIVGTLTHIGGLRGEDIGRIDILPQISFVEVPSAEVPRLCDALANATLGGRRLWPRPAEDWKFRMPQRSR
ncbi:MAG: ATP-dependent helicase DbpA [Thermoplasmata archaeon]|nr:ATP-dependent helicase DbpA [Thermoplasmata archaeon]